MIPLLLYITIASMTLCVSVIRRSARPSMNVLPLIARALLWPLWLLSIAFAAVSLSPRWEIFG